MNILIIDDDAEDTEIFCEALAEVAPTANCSVYHSCNEVTLLMKSQETQDFIFLDGHMPAMGGKECLASILKLIDTRRTNVVIYTGSLSPKEIEEFKKMGVTKILLKSFHFSELKRELAKLFAAA